MRAASQETFLGLLERDGELERCRRRVVAAAEGAGGVIALQGPPGAGKSSLLGAVREFGPPAEMRVLAGRGAQLETDIGYGLVRQLLEGAVRSAPADQQARIFAGAGRFARRIFDLEADEQPAIDDNASRMLHALYWVTVGLAEEAPLLLVADDLHWADRPSLRFLAFLAERLEDLHICLAVGLRGEEPGAPLDLLAAITARAELLEPRPLSQAAVAELVERELGPPDAEFVATCRQVSGGNPLYLSELLRELSARGIAPLRAAISEAERVTPAAISRAVPRRLAGLPAACRPLGTAVAVLGDGTSLAAARQLAGLDAEEAAVARDALVRGGVLAAGRELSFRHPILRGAFYEQLGPSERAAAHERAAAITRASDAGAAAVAAHLLATEPAGDPATAAALREAAEDAFAEGAADSAVAYLRRALAEPPPVEERTPLLALLGRAEHVTGDPACVEHLHLSRDASADPNERAETARHLANALRHQARLVESKDVLEDAEREAREHDPDVALELLAEHVQAAIVDLSLTEALVDRLEPHAAAPGATHGERAALATLGLARVWVGRGTVEDAVALAERAVAGGDLLSAHGVGESPLFGGAVLVFVLGGRLEDAHRLLADAEQDARDRGSPSGAMFVALMRTSAYLFEGRLAEAEAEGRRAAALAAAYGLAYGQAWAAAQLALILATRGRTLEVEQMLAGFGFEREIPGNLWFFNLFLCARAEVRLQRGDAEDAAQDALELGSRRSQDMPWRSLAADAFLRLGDGDRAAVLAREEIEEARRLGLAHREDAARVSLGLALGGQEGLELLHEAAETSAAHPARLFHVRALVELGAALRRDNQRAASRPILSRGLCLAEELGIDELAEQARVELRAAGGRPRHVLRSGADALTPSERRVAELAAEGLTNKEIAQSLFVTLKTVELHLTNTYRKLDISSRRALAGALGDR